jgi:hypothetical protein
MQVNIESLDFRPEAVCAVQYMAIARSSLVSMIKCDSSASADAHIQRAMQSVVEHDQNGKLHACKTAMDSLKLIASLQNRVIVNMDDQACSEAVAGLNAYYKVCYYPTLWKYQS